MNQSDQIIANTKKADRQTNSRETDEQYDTQTNRGKDAEGKIKKKGADKQASWQADRWFRSLTLVAWLILDDDGDWADAPLLLVGS